MNRSDFTPLKTFGATEFAGLCNECGDKFGDLTAAQDHARAKGHTIKATRQTTIVITPEGSAYHKMREAANDA